MDLESVAQAVSMLKTAIDVIRQTNKKLPDSSSKDEIEVSLMQAEKQLKFAEVEVANNLKYELCRNHFPPEIMLSADDTVWRCAVCSNEKNNGPKIGSISFLGS